MPSLPNVIVPLLSPFASLFDARTWRKVRRLLVGAVLAPGPTHRVRLPAPLAAGPGAGRGGRPGLRRPAPAGSLPAMVPHGRRAPAPGRGPVRPAAPAAAGPEGPPAAQGGAPALAATAPGEPEYGLSGRRSPCAGTTGAARSWRAPRARPSGTAPASPSCPCAGCCCGTRTGSGRPWPCSAPTRSAPRTRSRPGSCAAGRWRPRSRPCAPI